jgi:hypothetical protein
MRWPFGGPGQTKYVLDRTYRLTAGDWLPQGIQAADSFSALMFTPTPEAAPNNVSVLLSRLGRAAGSA